VIAGVGMRTFDQNATGPDVLACLALKKLKQCLDRFNLIYFMMSAWILLLLL
jgi:hypothetical protein